MLLNYIPVLHTTNMQLYSVFFSSSFHTIKFLRRVQHFLPSTESQAQLPSFDVVVRPKEIATHHSKRKPQGDEQQKVDKARKLKSQKVDKKTCNLCSSSRKTNWVCCSKCEQWQHCSCVGLSHTIAKKINFECSACKK